MTESVRDFFHQTGVDEPIPWETIENALIFWFTEATGLTTIWREQNAPQPPYPYAGLLIISGPTAIAPQDEQRKEMDLNQPQGQEILIKYVGPRVFTLSCQIFEDTEKAINRPAFSPRALMTIAQSSLSKESWLAHFRENGLAVQRAEAAANASAVVESGFLAQAAMDVIFHTSSIVEERTGYIEIVGVQSDELGVDEEFGG